MTEAHNSEKYRKIFKWCGHVEKQEWQSLGMVASTFLESSSLVK